MSTTLSYVQGAREPALIEQTIGAFFDAICERHADRDALIVAHQGVRWTYRELRERAERLAIGLRRLGLAPGDRVGIWSQNCSEWVLAQFATAKAGMILVNINPAYRRHELEYALTKVGCRAIIAAPHFKTSDYLQMLNDVLPELAASRPGELQAAAAPDLRFVIRLGEESTPGMLRFDDLLVEPAAAERQALADTGSRLDRHQPVNIQFTSGTTGSPKGATLTHYNILNNGRYIGDAMKLTEADRLCIPVPLYHCFGMVLGNLACVTHGAAMVYPSEGFDPLAVLQTVQAERCTGLHGVPTMFIAVLDHPQFGQFDLSTLRTGIMAGSPCPVEVMKRVVDQMHMREVTIAYGMTETSPVSFQSSADDPLDRRVSTVGRIQPHLEVKIIDEQGDTVPRGMKGELLTRGYSVMRGYWGDRQRTEEAIDAEGWMHTGDLATIDDEGYCNIVGRSKDMVIRGGENIYPREVEEFLFQHPKVQDVQCVGVPDDRYGEELCACIIIRPGMTAEVDEIRAFCQGQIAHYKIPRYVRFVDSFPMTVTGKIQKFILRDQIAQEMGLKTTVTA